MVVDESEQFRLALTGKVPRAFQPAIISAFADYRRADFFADLSTGLTVGIIARPLAIGFAIASGAMPQHGLWTGLVAGLAVALLGRRAFKSRSRPVHSCR